MADSDSEWIQAESEFESNYEIGEHLGGSFSGMVKARDRRSTAHDLVVSCRETSDGFVQCTTMGGGHIGEFSVPLCQRPLDQWLLDEIIKARPDVRGLLRLVDPESRIFCTRRMHDKFVCIKDRRHDGEDGVPACTVREISVLRQLSHRHVVRLFDTFLRPGKSVFVYEFVDTDLRRYMRASHNQLSPEVVKSLTNQLMLGAEFLHKSGVMHRDIKPDNLLIDRDFNLKIAGFGLARTFSIPLAVYTHEVVTVWYRPLEVLLGATLYGPPIDMWSCGCVVAEMASGGPLFAGDSDIGTIFKIFEKLGTPTEQQWEGLNELPHFNSSFPKFPGKPWSEIRNLSTQLGPEGLEILQGLLRYNPKERVSARTVLGSGYMSNIEIAATV